MKKILISLIAVVLLCSMAIGASAAWNNPFKDVKESHWFYDAVKTTVEKGIFNGMTEDTFQPNGKMTRAMFMTTLANMVGADVESYNGKTPFTDVKEGAWYAKYVQWAYENNITSGMNATTFGVNNSITREQMAAILYRYSEYRGEDTSARADISSYPDANKVSKYARDAFAWANAEELITGTSENGVTVLAPRASATRAQVATILQRFCEK